MSVITPAGEKVEILGEERRLLFTLNAMDAVEEAFDKSTLEAIRDMFDPVTARQAVRRLLSILLTDEAERERHFHPDSRLTPITEREAGWILDVNGVEDMAVHIVKAYGISMPEPEEGDPNPESGTGG